ncbi:hypothetical protein JCM10207_000299 [Rhodosporidiobolus poonsookiae]
MQRTPTFIRIALRARSPLFPSSASTVARFASTASSSASASPSQPQEAHPYLSQAQRAGASFSAPSSAGPFPLPSAADAAARAERIAQSQRQWSQLGTAQKAGRVATQGASFVVVLAGAGLVALVAYAVGSELFSEASPTRVFEDCVDRVKADPELSTMLLEPLTFHGTASGSRARHRRISHTYSADPATGAETLFVRFWIEARDPADAHAGESWMDWAKRWVGPAIWEDSHNPGAWQPRVSAEQEAEEERKRVEKERKDAAERRKTWGGWLSAGLGSALGGLTGGKGGLSGRRTDGEDQGGFFRRQRKPRLGEFSTGEVVAELQKDRQTGHFVYKQLFVAIPDTSHPSYYRHDIQTATIVPPADGEGEQQGPNRYRFWSRSKTTVA